MKEWETYLCFLVDSEGTVVFSPQGSSFRGTPSYEHGATGDDCRELKRAIAETAEFGRPVSGLSWSAKYGSEVREYLVSTDKVEHFVMVRLYRHESHKVVLTAVEAQVLQGIVDDLSSTEIARTMELSPTTVRRHVMSLKEKLGVSGRARMAIEAYRLGLIHITQ